MWHEIVYSWVFLMIRFIYRIDLNRFVIGLVSLIGLVVLIGLVLIGLDWCSRFGVVHLQIDYHQINQILPDHHDRLTTVNHG
jgi:hypothetical protein